MTLTFAHPSTLWLLVAVPLFALFGILLGTRRRRLASLPLILRLLVVTLLVLSIAEPLWATGANAASTVFVLDRSRSLTEETKISASSWITDALASGDHNDRAAIVTFGASPSLDGPVAPASVYARGWPESELDRVDPNFSNLESALALARALPLGGARRIVLLSDGAENVGSVLDQAAQAALDGVPIDVVPLPGVSDQDLRVDGATAPSSTWLGEPVTIVASVSVGVAGRGRVELWIDGVRKSMKEVELPAGLSSHAFEVTDLPAGFHTVEARVAPIAESDPYPENDSAPLALVVRDKPRVMLIAPVDSDPGVLRATLTRSGAEVTVIEPAKVPSRMSELGQFDAFVLNNVPASTLTVDQLAGLQEATRSLGRGLIVIGGTSSYGPGGYATTQLEETLPVTVKVADGRQRQRVAILLIIDKSGSMSYDPLGGPGKIEMAKEAARVSLHALAEGDQVGVIAFNDKQQEVVPMTTLSGDAAQWEEIDRQIAGIAADGGTEILPALSRGLDTIRLVDADARHIILLSDGKSRTGTRETYQKMLDDMMMDRTTLSTIAIGEDADTDLLNFLADEGGGRYHFTERPEEIPELTLEEARSAGNQSVIRGSFQAIQLQPSPILANFTPEELPPLDGYDFAEPKPDAQVILTSSRDDPVLAKWQYGLGRVVAWLADDGTDLAAAWPEWQRYDEFWAAVLRWALPDPENRPLQVAITRDGPESVVSVEVMGEAPKFDDSGQMTATITTPGGGVAADLPLARTGPGVYEMRVAAPTSGAYKIELRQTAAGQTTTELAGFAVPPSPELQPSPDGSILLRAIATRTGGRVLSLDDPNRALAGKVSGLPLRHYRPLWSVPLMLALGLLVVEIALRMRVLQTLGLTRLLGSRG